VRGARLRGGAAGGGAGEDVRVSGYLRSTWV
jgi:hypothetical protein